MQREFPSSCPFEQGDGVRHFVMSRGRIIVEPVGFNEDVLHLLFQELTRVRRPYCTGGDRGQDVILNDASELRGQGFGRKVS